MSSLPRGLGRGLDTLFSGSAPAAAPAGTTSDTPDQLPVTALFPNPSQPRSQFSRQSLEELAASIRSQGVIQPLLVRPRPQGQGYEIVAGERRWRAARLAGCTTVPVVVRDLSDAEVMTAALVENLQREDLTPLEEARALQAIRQALNITQEDLAARLGKSRSAVANALRLLQLSPAAQNDLQDARMDAGHARTILSLPDADAQEALRKAIVARKLTVRDAEAAAAYWKTHNAFPWQSPAAPPRSPRLPLMRSIQQHLQAHLEIPASVNGTPNKGRITLPYTSSEQLQGLLDLLGVGNDQFEDE